MEPFDIGLTPADLCLTLYMGINCMVSCLYRTFFCASTVRVEVSLILGVTRILYGCLPVWKLKVVDGRWILLTSWVVSLLFSDWTAFGMGLPTTSFKLCSEFCFFTYGDYKVSSLIWSSLLLQVLNILASFSPSVINSSGISVKDLLLWISSLSALMRALSLLISILLLRFGSTTVLVLAYLAF